MSKGRQDSQDGSAPEWTAGFRTGAKHGMTCDICRCLVREKPGDAKVHRAWHETLRQRKG